VLRFETEDKPDLQRHPGLGRDSRKVLPVSSRHRQRLFNEGGNPTRKCRKDLITVKWFRADDEHPIEVCFVEHRFEFGEPSRLIVTTGYGGDFIHLGIADRRQFNPWQFP
jgi:hypothetical protein